MLLSLLNVYIDIRMLVQLECGVCGNWKIRGFSTSSEVHLGPLINVLAVLDPSYKINLWPFLAVT